MQKKKIVIIGNPPLSQIFNEIPQRNWYNCVWFIPIIEAFKKLEQYEVHWIAITKEVRFPKVLKLGNQIFHAYPSVSLNWAQKTGYIASRYVVQRELCRIKPDLVHVWGTEGYYAISAKDWPGHKILSVQGILEVYCRNAKMSHFSERQALFEAETMAAYDLITVESQWGIDHVKQMVPGVPTRRWEYAVQEPFFAAQWNPAEKPRFVMAGTDRPIKNVQTALKAFASPLLSHVELVVAGGKAELHPEATPNIKFPGGLSRPEMVKLLSSAWGLIHPSLADTSPNIVKEARVMGLPAVISTECGGVQYVEHGKSGFVVEPTDVQGFIDGVLTIVQSRETAMNMGAHGWQECRRLLGSEVMVEGLLEIYGEML